MVGIDADATVLDALSLMSSQGVSSIAVLRGDKFVLGNISMTDVKVSKRVKGTKKKWFELAINYDIL